MGINGEENKKRLQIGNNYEIAGQLGRGKGDFPARIFCEFSRENSANRLGLYNNGLVSK
jgi:hypothetical protein